MFFCNCISCNQDWVSIKKVINSNFSRRFPDVSGGDTLLEWFVVGENGDKG